MRYVFKITEEGKLPEGIKATLARVIPEYAGKTVELELKEWKPTSSAKQLKYYCAVIVEAFQAHFHKAGKWHEKDDLHDDMMRTIGGFSNHRVNALTGEPDDGRLSYKRLTTGQAEGYHTLCRQYGAERYQLNILEPNETEFYKYDVR